MNTSKQALRWLGLPLLAALLLVQPVRAQEKNDTGKTTITIERKDGQRTVTVNGKVLSEEEADEFLEKEGIWTDERGDYSFRFSPDGEHFLRRFDVRAPKLDMKMPRGEFPMAYFYRDGAGGRLEDHLDGNVFFGLRGEDPVLHLRESMEEQAEVAKMEMESRRLAMEAREAEGAERERLEKELREKLGEIFAHKQALRQEHIDRLREQVDKTAREQQERQQARDEIIDRRLRELLGQHDKYDW